MPSPRECPNCGRPVAYSGHGRPPLWCSDRCRRRGHDHGIRLEQVVIEREVVRPERANPQRQIEQLLDSGEHTELLLRTIAHRWHHQGPPLDRAVLAPHLTRIWDAFHAAGAATKTPPTPPKLPTAAAERRAAVELVLSSPRSIAAVINGAVDMIQAGRLPDNNANTAVFNAIGRVLSWRRR
jgi:endogenous inhibitor of DNA gyrase (YacG/DUF329 family)